MKTKTTCTKEIDFTYKELAEKLGIDGKIIEVRTIYGGWGGEFPHGIKVTAIVSEEEE